MNWRDYIVSNPEVLLGKPVLKGTRISVELVLELLSNGWTEQMIFQSYPLLKEDHLKAIFSYLRECMEQEMYFSIPKSA